jgi:beta-glucosidase
MKFRASACAVAIAAVAQAADCVPVYKNPNATVDDRVSDLLKRMSIKEKMSQLIQGDMRSYLDLEDGKINKTGLEWTMDYRAHAVWTGLYADPEIIKKAANVAQDYLMEETELGIPAFIQSEGLHGFLAMNATIFNSPIAMSCAFNPELVEKMANVIAVEALALGVNQVFTPVADLGRELRFGRVEETFGEDPYLVGELAYRFAKGLQDKGVSAQVKHFAAFASPEQGLNTGPVHGGERELRSLYLPPLKRAVMDSGAYSVMSSYNSYDGIPVVANKHILTDILREEWGFEYYVISDAGGTARLADAFNICAKKDDECITMEASFASVR